MLSCVILLQDLYVLVENDTNIGFLWCRVFRSNILRFSWWAVREAIPEIYVLFLWGPAKKTLSAGMVVRPVSFYLEGFSAKQKSLHSRHIQVTCRTREHREQLKTTAPCNVGPWVLAGVEHNISQFQTFKCIPGTRLSFSTFRPLHNMRINATKIEISPQQTDMSQICWKYKPVFTLNTKYEQIPVEI